MTVANGENQAPKLEQQVVLSSFPPHAGILRPVRRKVLEFHKSLGKTYIGPLLQVKLFSGSCVNSHDQLRGASPGQQRQKFCQDQMPVMFAHNKVVENTTAPGTMAVHQDALGAKNNAYI